MTYEVDLFWSFRSPYSYLATTRVRRLEAEWNLTVNVRPVYPLAIRTPEFFEKAHPLWRDYLTKDVYRVADYLGLPFRWPSPDPVVTDRATGGFAAEQPFIHRLTRLGIAAVERGRGLPFIDEVSKLIWDGRTSDWHVGGHLARASERAGLDLAELEEAVERDVGHHEAAIRANEEALAAAGHWGVPTLAFQGEPFFGQDRIELCLWRMQNAGLQRRRE